MSPQIVTDLRSITSAANGARSHGPVTPEGKARSSRNSEKHGMYSRYTLLPHESPEAYEELRQRYHGDLAPANETQAKLVDRMVASAASHPLNLPSLTFNVLKSMRHQPNSHQRPALTSLSIS